jgi:hypothetical protein
LSITITVGSGRRIRVKGYGIFSNTNASADCRMFIYEGGTQLQEDIANVAGAGGFVTCKPEIILQPSVGSHTYKLRAQAGAGTATLNAGATLPAFIQAEDIGV